MNFAPMIKNAKKNNRFSCSFYTLKFHLLLILLICLSLLSILLKEIHTRENIKNNTKLTMSISEHASLNLIDKITSALSLPQYSSVLGSQSYNNSNEIDLSNMVLLGIEREILRNNSHLISAYTCGTNGKFVGMWRPEYSLKRNLKDLDLACFVIMDNKNLYSEDENLITFETEEMSGVAVDYAGRDWFAKALKSKRPESSGVYEDAVSKKPCITLSRRVINNKTKETVGVFAVDIGLDKLSSIIDDYKICKNSYIFLFSSEKGSLISQSNADENNKTNKPKGTETSPIAEKAITSFKQGKGKQFLLNHDGVEYVAIFSEFAGKINEESYSKINDWVVCSLIPSEYFVGGILESQNKIFVITLFVVFVILLLMYLFFNRISNHIVFLTEEAKKLHSFDLSVGKKPTTIIRELKSLGYSIETMRNNLESFSKFIPKDLVRRLLGTRSNFQIGGVSKKVTILFTDIEGFTSICETSEPLKISTHLSDYFEEITKIIFLNNGVVDKYMGDSVMAFWGSPTEDSRQSFNACKSALLAQKAIENLNLKWKAEGKSMVFKTRMGIHAGDVVAGNVGSKDHMNYTVLGDTVNIASRMEKINKIYHTSIIISEEIFNKIKNDCLAVPIDVVKLKGKKKEIKIYELMGMSCDEISILPSDKQVEFCRIFTKGYDLYQSGYLKEAREVFQSIKEKEEYLVNLYIKRCDQGLSCKKNHHPLTE